MTLTRRIIHHACWFMGAGPLVPLPLLLLLFFMPVPYARLINILREILPLVWVVAFLPALFTGILLAILPKQIYDHWIYRMPAGTILGIVVTAMYCCIASAFLPLAYIFPIMLISGLLSGTIMGLIIPWLPPGTAVDQ